MAYTEFYCQSGGSNLNAGSTTSNTALYTSIHGNWVNATGVFTPTDGVNPVSAGVTTQMWASVYVDGASESVSIGRITAVTNATNGAITANSSRIGTKPANQTGTATMKVGGAWLGPNAASGFPLTLATYGANVDSTSHMSCLNLKNDQTYTMTASFAVATGGAVYLVQGYTSSVRDGGKATFDGTTNTGAIMTDTGIAGGTWVDIIFTTSISSGATDLVASTRAALFQRCVFKGSRQSGFITTGGGVLTECEAYGNCTANTANTAGFKTTGAATFIRCVSHDNTVGGFFCSGTGTTSSFINCISDTNASGGMSISTGGAYVGNCDFYNNTTDAILIGTGAAGSLWIENCNFILNSLAGIDNQSVVNFGFAYNCGYGSGTQANGGADTIGNLTQSVTVTYAANVTPWVDPANGDFRIVLAAAQSTGRGAFTETATSYAGTVGYPDIGAAQALIVPNLRIPSLPSI